MRVSASTGSPNVTTLASASSRRRSSSSVGSAGCASASTGPSVGSASSVACSPVSVIVFESKLSAYCGSTSTESWTPRMALRGDRGVHRLAHGVDRGLALGRLDQDLAALAVAQAKARRRAQERRAARQERPDPGRGLRRGASAARASGAVNSTRISVENGGYESSRRRSSSPARNPPASCSAARRIASAAGARVWTRTRPPPRPGRCARRAGRPGRRSAPRPGSRGSEGSSRRRR